MTPLTNQELGHRVRSLEARAQTTEQMLTELTVQGVKIVEHASHMRSLLEEVRSTNRWAALLIVGTVLVSILALVVHGDGSARGTGSGSASAASQPSTSTTSLAK